jgi:hypothetical protein
MLKETAKILGCAAVFMWLVFSIASCEIENNTNTRNAQKTACVASGGAYVENQHKDVKFWLDSCVKSR